MNDDTFHWVGKRNFDHKEWSRLVNFFKIMHCELVSRGIHLKDVDGTGAPSVDDDAIAFNGNGLRDENHETFVLYAFNKNEMEFCKCSCKPYHLAVGTMLIACEKLAPGALSFSGDDKPHTKAWDEYRTLFGGCFIALVGQEEGVHKSITSQLVHAYYTSESGAVPA